MAKEVKLPEISEGVESASVAEVLVSEGDTIEKEQSIIAVETDKASVEVPSSDSGKVKEIKVKDGDEVKVGDVLLILEDSEDGEEEKKADKEEKGTEEKKDKAKVEKEESGEKEEKQEEKKAKKDEDEKEEKSAQKKEKEEPEEQKASKEKESKKPEAKGEKEADEKESKDEKQREKEGEQVEVPASPSVRRLARELGVDIHNTEGSGTGDRITEEDVKSAAKQWQSKGKKGGGFVQEKLPDFSQWGSVERESLSGIRMTTAKNVTASWQTIPHVFQFDEADISGIEEYIEKNRKKVGEAGGKLTITAILLKITANALQQFPKFNASIDVENEEAILKNYINIGIAVDTEKGLLVPVIRDVDKKTIVELALEITEISEKAREQKLSPEDMQGGNFSISNLGGIGGTNFTPIVYHPQVAILGVSRAETKAVFIDGDFEPRSILPLSLSYDHRLIDGAEGAAFLRWVGNALEDPYKALLGA
ncbi:2-oxo acid dehydrogenase subunit E2 [Marivirga sp. S37H4]|uniref:Dihydrolipoamide acetyltransferase component of pyruvate dehydrogenase complex n=1 Tax=Marivirga aurantiaca TaxID=2802615 RepID=A0A935C8F7_9BACT|nr:2-oxo acid dehydrogenase subunit E2 [Marivirga aurantiaca]MBK6265586.1 2-oxo acid dehydrogenase subunit E2 [Marivirga aurantiaca]